MERDSTTAALDNANKTAICMRVYLVYLVIELLNEQQLRCHSIISSLDSHANLVLLQEGEARG